MMVLVLAGAMLVSTAAQAQSDAGQNTPANDLDRTLAEIVALNQVVTDLEQRSGQDSGVAGRVLDRRLVSARIKLLDLSLEFAGAVIEAEKNEVDIAKYRQQAIDILSSQMNEARMIAADIRKQIELPKAGDPAAEQAAAYSRAFAMMDNLNATYEKFIAALGLSEQLGVDMGNLEQRLRQNLVERADNGSALLEIVLSDLSALRASAAVVPDDAEVKAKLAVATNSVSRFADGQAAVLSMMDGFEMDTARYQELLLLATGQLTSNVLEVGVFTNLLLGWGQKLWDIVIENGPGLIFNFILLVIIVFVFYKLANLTQMLIERALDNAELELSQLLRRMIRLLVRNVIIFLGVLIALSQIGISLGPLLAGLGVVGFIVGFALQDTLSNFAAGMLILIYRPFDVDDYIEVSGVTGTVSHMSLVNTTITTLDNQVIVVPNNKIWGDVIKNVTAQTIRRIDMVFGISYADDIPQTEKILQGIMESNESVLDDPEPMVRVQELGDSSVNFAVRPWVKTEDYFETYWSITRAVKMRFDEEGISIPFPQTDVHLYKD
jgi:small conductance mechanosensitive channel